MPSLAHFLHDMNDTQLSSEHTERCKPPSSCCAGACWLHYAKLYLLTDLNLPTVTSDLLIFFYTSVKNTQISDSFSLKMFLITIMKLPLKLILQDTKRLNCLSFLSQNMFFSFPFIYMATSFNPLIFLNILLNMPKAKDFVMQNWKCYTLLHYTWNQKHALALSDFSAFPAAALFLLFARGLCREPRLRTLSPILLHFVTQKNKSSSPPPLLKRTGW